MFGFCYNCYYIRVNVIIHEGAVDVDSRTEVSQKSNHMKYAIKSVSVSSLFLTTPTPTPTPGEKARHHDTDTDTDTDTTALIECTGM